MSDTIKIARKTNKGIGAGGANTNKSGKEFEQQTSIVKYLEELKFQKVEIGKGKMDYVYEKTIDNIKITFVQQTGFVTYCKQNFNISFDRRPDEAFIIKKSEKDYDIKIIEKKNQMVSGTVDSKIYNGEYFKYEYSQYFKENKELNFKIYYSYCLSEYFKNKFETEKKWKLTKAYCQEKDIKIFFPCEEKCYQEIFDWILPGKLKIGSDKKDKSKKIKSSEIDELSKKMEKVLVI